jgi:DNA-binding FrmR family transcriptional regulator
VTADGVAERCGPWRRYTDIDQGIQCQRCQRLGSALANSAHCIDILTQMAAVTKALQAVAVELLGDHLGHCVSAAIATGSPEAQEKIVEATEAIARLVRS